MINRKVFIYIFYFNFKAISLHAWPPALKFVFGLASEMRLYVKKAEETIFDFLKSFYPLF